MSHKLVIFIFSLLAPTWVWAQVTLRSLSDVSSLVWTSNKSPTVFVFFQKDCSVCKKQISKLSCLKNQKDTLILLIGAFSEEAELRNEVKKIQTPYPFYYASKKDLKYFGILDLLTPQILISKSSKNKKFLGLTSCSKIKRTLKKI